MNWSAFFITLIVLLGGASVFSGVFAIAAGTDRGTTAREARQFIPAGLGLILLGFLLWATAVGVGYK